MWEEIKFDVKHPAGIERFAMVGDMQWQHVLAVFCEPFTRAKCNTSITPALPGRESGWRSRSNL
jgi:hypothetical protein